ncbi:MAG: UDP-N-acetylglucosamine 1-carboxyvinyltransferase [Actinobacteria bacterium]|nr:UDP-N-acetylglucosamine 1-carboxyvinyltransferase [Actinomycetota bacterium]|tara:strand:- start:20348 stop:21601 length:1254 start_codon:yes stop_codon:yes gene_type:complete
MEKISARITGGKTLKGKIGVSGAKNAVLPVLASTIMLGGETTLLNIPSIGDINSMVRMLNSLNIRTEYRADESIHILNEKKVRHIAPYELVTAMRASFFVAGPLLAKTGFAKVPLPGGCSIGLRPVDIHIQGFEKLGVEINFEHGFVEFSALNLKGNQIDLPFPSVGATENIMMAACLAKGETVIRNSAREPEIVDLANFLIQAGALIEGVGSSTIHVQGVQSLSGVKDYFVIPDRIEIGTLLIAGGLTGGDIEIENVNSSYLSSITDMLTEAGLIISYQDNNVRCSFNGDIHPVNIVTAPHPGFPTDMQAQMMTLLTAASGHSVVKETIFENRFMHVHELIRMGASITIDGQSATVKGGKLSAADVKITDLRAGAALVLAGLIAEGKTTVHGLHHLNRGYYNLIGKLRTLGAEIDL